MKKANANPKISILMSIYNTNNEELVGLAIDSILNQTYGNFEFIICDDGSTDGSYELVEKITKDDERCILFKNKVNSGLAQSLNNCLRKARGEYIARMDADDISKLDRLEREVEFLDSHPEYALVSGWGELFDDTGVYGLRKYVEYPQKEDMLFGPPFLHAGMMMRKDVLERLGGYRVCKETLRAEDYDLWMRLYAAGFKGYNLQCPVYMWREDKNAYKRRKYKFRFDEAKVRYKGFRSLKLFPIGYIYVLKPLIVGLMPQRLLRLLRILRGQDV